MVEFSKARENEAGRLASALRAVLTVQTASDPNVRGVGILDMSGTVKIATEQQLVGKNLSYRGYVRQALQGGAVISDIHLAEAEVGYAPTIAYVTPVAGPGGQMTGLMLLWVRAQSLWDVAKASNELAGPNSFAVVFDRLGIRIAHTCSDDIVFHPGGELARDVVDRLTAERRFGEKTRELLQAVRPFPEQFDRARSSSPNLVAFRGYAPINQKWNYGVARRLETVPWTIFYMIPEESLEGQITALTRERVIFGGAMVLVALVAGTLFAAVILGPVRSLSGATKSIAGGDLLAVQRFQVLAQEAKADGRGGQQ